MIKNFTKQQLADKVLAYYDKNARSLPWRDNPSPYRVWVSEIMLQQTRVDTVIDYFNRFMAVFPTVKQLAEADEATLLKQWEGLGYYSRVRNLQKAAKTIIRHWGGSLPQEKKDLLTLAGIGDYTAGAIASIAYGKDEIAVDGNLIRVACRLLAYDGNVWNAQGKRKIVEFWESVLPKNQASFFNQGIMDIGATICLPNGVPNCEKCPISVYCQSFLQGNPLDYPIKKAKKQRKIEEKTVLLLFQKHQVMVQPRPEKGVLAGLLAFPMIEGQASKEDVIIWLEERGCEVKSIQQGEKAKHIFTHMEWHMSSWEIEIEDNTFMKLGGCMEQWVDLVQIDKITLPTAFKVFRKKVRRNRKNKNTPLQPP